MGPASILIATYDYRLIVLSIFISIVASYVALDMAERVTTSKGAARSLWLLGGATSMGAGIWTMHFTGMEALRLPVPVQYGWPTVALSLLAAIVSSWIALYIVSRPAMGLGRTLAGSLFMGGGISVMHYTGMQAMRMPGMAMHSPAFVTLSVAVAIASSFVALRLVFASRQDEAHWGLRKIGSAIIIGLAIPIMHYVDVSTVVFKGGPSPPLALDHAVDINRFGLWSVPLFALLLLCHSSYVSFADRRYQAQIRLFEAGQLELHAIFDNMAEAIAIVDCSRRIVQLNSAASRLFEVSRDEVTLESITEGVDAYSPTGALITPARRPSALALEGHYVRNFEMTLRSRGSGKSKVVEATTAPIGTSTGLPQSVIIAYRDITERKLVDDARARLAAIVESSDDAIIGKDLWGIVTSWNGGAEKVFGYSAAEMIGQSIARLLPPGSESEENEILARIQAGETLTHGEAKRVKKGGQTIYVSLAISPIRNSANEIVGASKIARDITTRKQLEIQLSQTHKMQALGALTGGIAHDFNNLLGVVLGNLDLLERQGAGNEQILKRVQTAQKAVLRGADLTKRLLAFSSREVLNPAAVSVEATIDEVIELGRRTLGPEIAIATHFESELPPVIADPGGLENALLNLALNARDAMPRGGSLTFNVNSVEIGDAYPLAQTGELEPGTYICISVSDSGHGMSPQTMQRAFEPFFTTKGREKGTGLGLAMVYGFAKQSGGAVRLYSEVGIGTTVSLYMRPAKGPMKLAPLPHGAATQAKLGGTALVVDDEVALLDIAEHYLAELGYVVLTAEDSARAIEIVNQGREIDLLVTDIFMPGQMNGVELAQQIREMRPGIRVIFSSGFPVEALPERSGKLVDGPLLHKPYRHAEFSAIVRQTMAEDLRYGRFEAGDTSPTDGHIDNESLMP